MILARALVWIVGGLFVAYGLAFALAPTDMARLVTGDAPGTASGIIDLRATYGGMSIAVGAGILLLGRRRSTIRLALSITAIVLFAMAATRCLGFVVDGSPNAIMWIYLISEIVGGALALYARQALGDGD